MDPGICGAKNAGFEKNEFGGFFVEYFSVLAKIPESSMNPG
jgi:hypothetical protein